MEEEDKDLDYIDNLSREEIVEHLMALPLVDLRIRLKAFESAKKAFREIYKTRLENDPELAAQHKKDTINRFLAKKKELAELPKQNKKPTS